MNPSFGAVTQKASKEGSIQENPPHSHGADTLGSSAINQAIAKCHNRTKCLVPEYVLLSIASRIIIYIAIKSIPMELSKMRKGTIKPQWNNSLVTINKERYFQVGVPVPEHMRLFCIYWCVFPQ